MSIKYIYLIVSCVFVFHGAPASAVANHELIHRCIDYLSTTTTPHGRVRVLKLGASVHDKPGLNGVSHAVFMMEQKTSHNFIVLLKPLALGVLTDLNRKVLRVSPHELVLIELSGAEREQFFDDSLAAGTVALTVPQRGPEDLEYGPIFPGTLLDVDGRYFVVTQVSSESNYLAGESLHRTSTFVLAGLPDEPTKGMVGTQTHTLKIWLDRAFELDGQRGRTLKNIGQATVVVTMLLNAMDGPQLKAELLEVASEHLLKLANARELLIKGFRASVPSDE